MPPRNSNLGQKNHSPSYLCILSSHHPGRSKWDPYSSNSSDNFPNHLLDSWHLCKHKLGISDCCSFRIWKLAHDNILRLTLELLWFEWFLCDLLHMSYHKLLQSMNPIHNFLDKIPDRILGKKFSYMVRIHMYTHNPPHHPHTQDVVHGNHRYSWPRSNTPIDQYNLR